MAAPEAASPVPVETPSVTAPVSEKNVPSSAEPELKTGEIPDAVRQQSEEAAPQRAEAVFVTGAPVTEPDASASVPAQNHAPHASSEESQSPDIREPKSWPDEPDTALQIEEPSQSDRESLSLVTAPESATVTEPLSDTSHHLTSDAHGSADSQAEVHKIHQEDPRAPSPLTTPVSESETEHTHFSFLDDALAQNANERRTSQSPQMSAWDEAALEDQIAHSSWHQHTDEHESQADEPENLDTMEPEHLHALMQRNKRQSVQPPVADDFAPASAAEHEQSGTDPVPGRFDDVVARLRAARTEDAVEDHLPQTFPHTENPAPHSKSPSHETKQEEASAPWVPAWERDQQPEEHLVEPEPGHEEDDELPVWAKVSSAETPETHSDTAEILPAEADKAETRHVLPTVDVTERLRSDILRRGSALPQTEKPRPMLEQAAFWKKAWIASGVCAGMGLAAFWHWFGALREIWPALNLL
ncbi:hypothetical protein [Acetobacter fallax]|uniref:hypothetical protein n=1 Tax=Acetobacter fallax TaxID=1737473 RepID=UPI001F554AD9|nr:hypothetical protein [Acetobacter fallax]